MKINNKKVFMKPGKTNDEDRDNFIKFWAEYIKSVSDKEWSVQQNLLIDSQLQNANHDIYLKANNLKRRMNKLNQ